MPHSADGGDAAEAYGQHVYAARDPILRLYAAEHFRIQHLQAGHLPLLAGSPCHGTVRARIFLHYLKLPFRRFLARQLYADFNVLYPVDVEFCHKSAPSAARGLSACCAPRLSNCCGTRS